MTPIFLFLVACASEPPLQNAPADPSATETTSAPTIPTLQGGTRLEPFDEGAKDPSFAAFRKTLIDIISRKDHKALLALIDPKIRFTFGAGGGLKDFEKEWKPADPASPLWSELGEVIALGGSFQRGAPHQTFIAPYTFSNWPESVDGFEHLAAVCEKAIVREAPDATAKPIVRLDHHMLKIAEEDPLRKGERDSDWRKVALPDEREGWIESRCARSHVDYRAAFEREGEVWRMVFFVAGD